MTYRQTLLILIALSTNLSFGQMRPHWQFKDELMAHLISPNDTIYIQDRRHLERFTGLISLDSAATINYLTKTGDKVFIGLTLDKFEPKKHKLDLTDTVYKFVHNEKRVDYLKAKNLIDGKPGYGLDGNFPKTEIKSLRIKLNNIWLTIPKESFTNFYDVHPETTQAYLSKDKTLIYMYVSASDGAGSYSLKFVFDKTKYVTRLISTNECTDGYDYLDAIPKQCGD